jgi:hypothetical protein
MALAPRIWVHRGLLYHLAHEPRAEGQAPSPLNVPPAPGDRPLFDGRTDFVRGDFVWGGGSDQGPWANTGGRRSVARGSWALEQYPIKV